MNENKFPDEWKKNELGFETKDVLNEATNALPTEPFPTKPEN